MTLYGQRALITGGSRGIGLAYAQCLHAAGCAVVINHFQDGVQARREIQALGGTPTCFELDADVADPAACRSMVRRAADLLGGLDILVSNAGICEFKPIMEVSDDLWQRHLAVNLSAGFFAAQEAARIMLAAGTGGRIIFTTSIGAFRSNATQTHYCATKGGLHLLMQGMALELGGRGITVNAIAPGWIHTDINDAASRDTPAVRDWLGQNCPVGRLGTPADLQAALLFLASREAGYVNGATINVDGGWNAQL